MIKLYEHELSGNCYKVKLMLSLLGLKYATAVKRVWVFRAAGSFVHKQRKSDINLWR